MKRSTDRILTTHVGSLPRTQAVTDVIFGREKGEVADPAGAARTITQAVHDVVRRQREVGIDVVSDGEMSKVSYATYVAERLSGFDGDTPREPGQDLLDFRGCSRSSPTVARRPSIAGRAVSVRLPSGISSRCGSTWRTCARP